MSAGEDDPFTTAMLAARLCALDSSLGGMILRGPGAKADPAYSPIDIRVYDLLGKEGERLLPGYHYFISWKDLYTVHGATTDHFYGTLGAFAFTNELYQAPADFDKDGNVTEAEMMKFNDLLSLGRQFIPYHKYQHPQFGQSAGAPR